MECSRQKIAQFNLGHTIWDDSESDHDEPRAGGSGMCGGSTDAQLERNCSDLYEDDEDSDHVPR